MEIVKKNEMAQKIRVAVICDTLQEAQDFISKLTPDALKVKCGISEYSVETNVLRIDWIKTGAVNFLGWRLNYVYTTKEVCDSEWFRTIIMPMFIVGIGDICLWSNPGS